MYREPTVSDIARAVSTCVIDNDQSMAIRLMFRIVERYDKCDLVTRAEMIRECPPPTGDRRYDAMLAAVVEYCCAVRFILAPAWVQRPEFFLDTFWFPAGLPGLEAEAFANSPISFSRRGIFINSGSLTYA